MAAPLRSANPELAKSMQFSHFGVLDTGSQSKASTATSILLNIAIACVVIIIGAAARKTIATNTQLTHLELVPIKKEEPPKPKIIPPKPKPLPQIVRVEPKIVDLPKPIEQPKVPVVGLLNAVSFDGPYAVSVAAIRQGLQETGFVEGQNLAIE